MKRESKFKQWAKKIRQKRLAKRKHYSIDRILWSSFALFAICVILITGCFQLFTTRKVLKEQITHDINMVVTEAYLYFDSNRYLTSDNINEYLYYISVTKNINARILDARGNISFPNWQGSGDENFSELITYMQEKLKDDPNKRGVSFSDANNIYYIGYLNNSKSSYLCISKSLEIINDSMQVIQVQTLFLTILALLVAFLTSGVIAMRLSKPFTEMTNKAKELEKGNFDIDFSGQYYYSEMDDLAKGLNSMRTALSNSDKMQKELIANVSHDMKTPLTMIKAYASMIQEISGDNKEKRTLHTQVIIDESDRLATLVSDILDLSKIRAGIDTLNFSVFNLSEYVYSIIRKFDYLEETQSYHFLMDVENDLYVNADREKIGQIIYNLVGNAVNYTGDDKKITISLKREKELIHLRITDTGKGIKEDEIDTIWDRYYRSEETHKRPAKGTGIGLSIVKAICEKHNLVYGVESTVGVGSTFYVDFYSVKRDPSFQL